MTAVPTRILLLEDSEDDALLTQTALLGQAPGEFTITCVSRLDEALALIRSENFDVALSDLSVPDSVGLATAQAIIASAPELPLVVLTGLHDEELGRAALRIGAQDYLVKGESGGGLIARTLRYALERKRLEQALRRANEALEKRVAERTADLQAALALLTEREARYRSVTESANDCIVITDKASNILSWNRAAEREFGYTAGEIAGKTMKLLIPQPDWDQYLADLEQVLSGTAADNLGKPLERIGLRKNGSAFPMELSLATWETTERFISATIRDISERRHMEDQVRQMAFHDALTKLPNRRLLNDRLNQAMAATKRSGCYGALMFLDLDDFKWLNDTHGHEVGDLLLIEAAERLKASVREMDTVARFGGDEFVVMISELSTDEASSRAQAGIIAEKIRSALAGPYVFNIKAEGKADAPIEHRCTASIGVALFNKHDAGQADILKWADTAMYQAKEAGCNLIQFYDPKTCAAA